MFKVLKEKEYVTVTVAVQKRRLAKDPKIYYYYRDALAELRRVYPDIKINEIPEVSFVVSSVRAPHEGTWKFKILETEQDESSKNFSKKNKKVIKSIDSSDKEEKALTEDLTNSTKSATMEETTEKVQEPTE